MTYKGLMDLVFTGCVDTADKVFCLIMFMFTVEMFVGVLYAFSGGARKR